MASFLSDMTWVEAGEAARRGAIVLLPQSPTEQHGPHLPLGTDWLETSWLAARAADLLALRGVEAIVAPIIPQGVAEGGASFPGNITLRPETLESLVVDMGASLAQNGFRKMALVCVHTEPRNSRTLQRAVARLREEHGVQVVETSQSSLQSWWPKLPEIIETDPNRDHHAGEMETSAMQAIRPDLVRPGWEALPPVLVDLGKEMSSGKTMAQIAEGQGYFGAPARATVAKGKTMMELWAQAVADLVMQLVEE